MSRILWPAVLLALLLASYSTVTTAAAMMERWREDACPCAQLPMRPGIYPASVPGTSTASIRHSGH